jgi:rhodanese-related sulfurtransferase
MIRAILLVAAISAPTNTTAVQAERPKSSVLATSAAPFPAGPYCGIYCLHRAMRSIGQEVPIEKLHEARYVGSNLGSSTAELVSGATDHGVSAVAIEGITADALRASECPIILHVAGNALSTRTNHWFLYLGDENGEARIYDPPQDIALVSYARLMAISDGVGIEIRSHPVRRLPIAMPSLRFMGLVLTGLVAIVALRNRAMERSPFPRGGHGWAALVRTCGAATVLASVGCALGIVYDATNADGLLRNSAAVASVTNKYLPELTAEVAMPDVRRVSNGEVVGVIIDARTASAYAQGHIPNAVNVPIDGGLFSHRAILNRSGTAAPVYVYCQGPQCLWAREVAFRLLADGFSDVRVFPGGWQAWSEQDSNHGQRRDTSPR